MLQSLPAWGAWVEIGWSCERGDAAGRSPHGERGLKSACSDEQQSEQGRSPHGERGLKSAFRERRSCLISRSPHGERGLKCRKQEAGRAIRYVAPRMGSVG